MGDIRVLIVDGHEKVRQELTAALERERGLEIVGAAGNGQEALRQARSLRPDLVLLDVKMEDGRGVETCRKINDMVPMTRVVILTSYVDEAERDTVLSAGACAYLLKDIGTKQLIHAIRALGIVRMAAGEGKDDRI